MTTRVTTISSRSIAAAALILASGAFLYRDVFIRLLDAWTNDGNYSHGFLIIPLALYLVWERRDRLMATTVAPTAWGAIVIAGSLALLLAGVVGSELFLTRISLVGMVVGTCLFLLGWQFLRILTFPIGILLLMIPIPAIIFNQIAFPLQLWASRFGENVLSSVEIPVLREGNVLILANTTLEVAEACSGIRSLISLLTLGIVFGYFTDRRGLVRTMVALSTIPIAIIANGIRVAGTGIAAHYIGREAAEGFLHEFSGWMLFLVAFALLALVQRIILRVMPAPPADAARDALAA